STDQGVFIRSMATHGALGGLCRSAGEAVDLLSASGRDLVLLETVGVGQDEVDVMRLAHTTVVVSVPGLGDESQALKAGIMEIADLTARRSGPAPHASRGATSLRTAARARCWCALPIQKGLHPMFDPEALKRVAAMRRDWEEHELADFVERQPETRDDCRTGSGL